MLGLVPNQNFGAGKVPIKAVTVHVEFQVTGKATTQELARTNQGKRPKSHQRRITAVSL